jgi:hypothetical protein
MTRRHIRLIVLTALMAVAASCSASSTASSEPLATLSVVATTVGAIPSALLDSPLGSNPTVVEPVRQPCAVGAVAVVTKFLQAIDARDPATSGSAR